MTIIEEQEIYELGDVHVEKLSKVTGHDQN